MGFRKGRSPGFQRKRPQESNQSGQPRLPEQQQNVGTDDKGVSFFVLALLYGLLGLGTIVISPPPKRIYSTNSHG